MTDELGPADKLAIRETVENWVVWRDAGNSFATVWHADGWMTATCVPGPYTEFIKISKKAFEEGMNILHQLGGWSCDVAGNRAISQTKMAILQRGQLSRRRTCGRRVLGPLLRLLREAARPLGMLQRHFIYEKDRLDTVDPAATLSLTRRCSPASRKATSRVSPGQGGGSRSRRPCPGCRDRRLQKLYAEGKAWLEGAATPRRAV